MRVTTRKRLWFYRLRHRKVSFLNTGNPHRPGTWVSGQIPLACRGPGYPSCLHQAALSSTEGQGGMIPPIWPGRVLPTVKLRWRSGSQQKTGGVGEVLRFLSTTWCFWWPCTLWNSQREVTISRRWSVPEGRVYYSQDVDTKESTKPEISRLDWRKYRQKSVS